MELQTECISCNIAQVLKVSKTINLSRDTQKVMMSAILKMLSQIDYSLCNPEVMKKTWGIICEYAQTNDPYQDIKKMYNLEILNLYEDLSRLIWSSPEPFLTATKIATLGNIIDFSANGGVDIETIYNSFKQATETTFSIDHIALLQEKLKTANKVVYIGDNCGEIVVDKLYIETMKKQYACDFYYIVREAPIINDVTIVDADMVSMNDVATVVSSGDNCLGLVLEHTSKEFQDLFFEADVIIAKGQGNFEGLYEIKKENMFHLFMVKCQVMERILQVKQNSIVCLRKGETK